MYQLCCGMMLIIWIVLSDGCMGIGPCPFAEVLSVYRGVLTVWGCLCCKNGEIIQRKTTFV